MNFILVIYSDQNKYNIIEKYHKYYILYVTDIFCANEHLYFLFDDYVLQIDNIYSTYKKNILLIFQQLKVLILSNV